MAQKALCTVVSKFLHFFCGFSQVSFQFFTVFLQFFLTVFLRFFSSFYEA